MFVIFGWMKTRDSLGAVTSGYCYDCRRTVPWIIGKQTEWVTLYGMKTLPFLAKYYFVCGRCDDNVGLSRAEYWAVDRTMKRSGKIDGAPVHQALVDRIERQQLSDKTEVQMKWMRASLEAERERRESRESDHIDKPG